MRAKAPRGKIGEDDLIEMGEHVCDPDTDEGEWITMIDLDQEKQGSPIKLSQQPHLGECRRECRTISHACALVSNSTTYLPTHLHEWYVCAL